MVHVYGPVTVCMSMCGMMIRSPVTRRISPHVDLMRHARDRCGDRCEIAVEIAARSPAARRALEAAVLVGAVSRSRGMHGTLLIGQYVTPVQVSWHARCRRELVFTARRRGRAARQEVLIKSR